MDMLPAQQAPVRTVLVTGVAGFIGSTITDHLNRLGIAVIGIDHSCNSPRQHSNLAAIDLDQLHDVDVLDAPLHDLLAQVDAVIHLAGTPGVQTSWSTGFEHHVRNNVVTTQRLCEAALDTPVQRIVVASSSSVYGSIDVGLADEAAPVRPLSPYGASKAGMEHVLHAYAQRGLPVVPLRYFTVYGPRQRPDMAIYKMMQAVAGGTPFPLRGDGSQQRNFTFVDDAARATIAALSARLPAGCPLNVAGPTTQSVNEVLSIVAAVGGGEVPVAAESAHPGDPQRTAADASMATELLNWCPTVSLTAGIERQWEWFQTDRVVGAATVARPRTR